MIQNESKYREYIQEYPDQVFVNQKNILGDSIDYDPPEIGFVAVQFLDNNLENVAGSRTRHEECIVDVIRWTATHYRKNTDINPSGAVYDLVEEMLEVGKDESGLMDTIAVFLPFIRDVEHESELLDSLHENLFTEPYYQVILEGPKQNRFWISKF